MKALFLKEALLMDLMGNIHSNLDKYRNGDFQDIMEDPSSTFETELEIDDEQLKRIECTENDHNEVACCLAIHSAFRDLSGYLARDPRLWTYLTHSKLLNYSRKRWPIPSDDNAAIKHIRTHFFCVGQRGIERDNAASRLWWQAALCNRVERLTLEEALTAFLHKYDVRANIVERPSTSQNIVVFSSIIHKLHESLNGDESLFDRAAFRDFMKKLNLAGGVRLLPALSQDSVDEVIEKTSYFDNENS